MRPKKIITFWLIITNPKMKKQCPTMQVRKHVSKCQQEADESEAQ